MNLNEQLQQAYEAGRRQALNESDPVGHPAYWYSPYWLQWAVENWGANRVGDADGTFTIDVSYLLHGLSNWQEMREDHPYEGATAPPAGPPNMNMATRIKNRNRPTSANQQPRFNPNASR
jgi:hypothetical protein